jgi:hypothetical protein
VPSGNWNADNFRKTGRSGAIGQTESTVGDSLALFRGSGDSAQMFSDQQIFPLPVTLKYIALPRLKRLAEHRVISHWVYTSARG